MKKLLIILALMLGAYNQADAQFLKKLGNAIEKAAQTVDNVANTILGEPNSSNQKNKQSTKSQKTEKAKQETSRPQQSAQETKPSQQTPPATTQKTSSTVAAAQPKEDSTLIIKNRGIAGIRIGMKMSKVPKSIPGLYDGYREDYGCEMGVSYWCNVTVPGEYNHLNIDDVDENGIIDGISVQVPGVRIAGTDIVIGKPFSEIVNLPGVKKKVDKDDPENYYYVYQGIYYLDSGTLDILSTGDETTERLSSISWGLNQ